MYILKPLTIDDLMILNIIYLELEKIIIKSAYQNIFPPQGGNHGIRTGVTKQKEARQAPFGVIKFRGKEQLSYHSKKYPHIDELLRDFMDNHNPEFEYTMVYINKNTVCQPHRDTGNQKNSIIVGLGPYTGGETCIELSDGSYKEFDISTNSLQFDGTQLKHYNKEFTGVRYSLVFV